MVGQILETKAEEMTLVDWDDMVERFAASTVYPSFCNAIVPGTPHSCLQGFDATCL